jgi:hypothetical protein
MITQMFMYALYLVCDGRFLLSPSHANRFFAQAVGIVVYWYCGQYVASPALGSAGREYFEPVNYRLEFSFSRLSLALLKKVAYGIVLPALIASSVLYTHVSPRLSIP